MKMNTNKNYQEEIEKDETYLVFLCRLITWASLISDVDNVS